MARLPHTHPDLESDLQDLFLYFRTMWSTTNELCKTRRRAVTIKEGTRVRKTEVLKIILLLAFKEAKAYNLFSVVCDFIASLSFRIGPHVREVFVSFYSLPLLPVFFPIVSKSLVVVGVRSFYRMLFLHPPQPAIIPSTYYHLAHYYPPPCSKYKCTRARARFSDVFFIEVITMRCCCCCCFRFGSFQ